MPKIDYGKGERNKKNLSQRKKSWSRHCTAIKTIKINSTEKGVIPIDQNNFDFYMYIEINYFLLFEIVSPIRKEMLFGGGYKYFLYLLILLLYYM